jgi:hypothetical protein
MKTFEEQKELINGITGYSKEINPVQHAVKSFLSKFRFKAIQTGNLDDAETKTVIILNTMNKLLFNIEVFAENSPYFDEEIKKEFEKIYKDNNNVIKELCMISKSRGGRAISAMENMFTDKYVFNQHGLGENQVKQV